MAMDFSKSKGASIMKDIQKKSVEQSDGLVAINIPLELLDENPENSNIFNMEGIETLADGIKRDGFLGAINVFKKDDGRYEISSGHRRYRAMKLLGEKTIPCMVSPYPPSEADRMLKLISSNIRNRDMKPMDWARALNKYMDIIKLEKSITKKKGNVRDLAAEYFQMASSNIGRYLALLKLIPKLQELADDPEYSSSALSQASVLSEEEQNTLYERMMDEQARMPDGLGTKGLSKARIIQMINDLKDKPDNSAQGTKTKGNYVSAAVDGPEDEDYSDDSDIGADDKGGFSGENAGYYTEFRDGNPLEGGMLNGTIEGFQPIKDNKKELFGKSEQSTAEAGIDESAEEEANKTALSACISEVETLADADADTSIREILRDEVKRLESAIEKLKKKYVL